MTKTFFYIPNLIDYARVVFLSAAVIYLNRPVVFLILYLITTILDSLDGYAARKLNQTSAFGAWLDVVIDIISRGIVWTYIFQHFGFLVACLEWIAFIATHSRGKNWKSSFKQEPWMIREVFKNGFYSPLGILALLGLHGLPMYLFAYYTGILTSPLGVPLLVQDMGLFLLITCRAFCAIIEIYVISDYVMHLANVR